MWIKRQTTLQKNHVLLYLPIYKRKEEKIVLGFNTHNSNTVDSISTSAEPIVAGNELDEEEEEMIMNKEMRVKGFDAMRDAIKGIVI